MDRKKCPSFYYLCYLLLSSVISCKMLMPRKYFQFGNFQYIFGVAMLFVFIDGYKLTTHRRDIESLPGIRRRQGAVDGSYQRELTEVSGGRRCFQPHQNLDICIGIYFLHLIILCATIYASVC